MARLKESIVEMPGTYAEDSFFSFQERTASNTKKV